MAHARVWARPTARRLMWTLAFVSYLIAGWASQHTFAAPMGLDPNTRTVVAVAPGSYVWAVGVRPGLPADPWPMQQGASAGVDIQRSDGSSIGIPLSSTLPFGTAMWLAATLLVVGVLASKLGVPGFASALGLSVAAALGPLTPALGYPTGVLLATIPCLVAVSAGVATRRGYLGRKHIGALLASAVVSTASVAVLVVATLVPTAPWPWEVLWILPAATVLTLGVLGSLPMLLNAARHPGSLEMRVDHFLGQALPLVRNSRIHASAAERKRLAAELHNEVLPQLGQAILEIDANDPRGRSRLEAVTSMIRSSLARRQATTLERGGLAAAIESYVSSQSTQIPVLASVKGSGGAPRPVQVAAYRICQLAFANALEHASPERVEVTLEEERRYVRLEVHDDGVGIDALAERQALIRGHLGLAEMRAQAESIGAYLDIRSSPERGTTIGFTWLQ